MPGGTGHATGAGPQAKESGSDFRRRNPEAMFVTRLSPGQRRHQLWDSELGSHLVLVLPVQGTGWGLLQETETAPKLPRP